MNSFLILAALVSGFFFGLWPLIMKRSGLDGFTSALLFELVALLTVMPFSIHSGITIANTKWWFGVTAGVVAGFGLVIFTSALAKATQFEVAKVFLIMLAIQAAVPALYSVIINNGLNIRTGFGLVTAILTVILLA